jgi:hypothetical protein
VQTFLKNGLMSSSQDPTTFFLLPSHLENRSGAYGNCGLRDEALKVRVVTVAVKND